MSIAVQTEDGPYFCVGDSVFVMGNIDAPQAMQDELHYDICPPGRFVDIVAAWETVRDHVRRCKEAGVDPHKHLLLAHDVILSAAVEKYEDSHDNKIPVIGNSKLQSSIKMLKKQQQRHKQNILVNYLLRNVLL